MPQYNYTAKSLPQKTVNGTIEAESEQEAISKLAKMGYFPIRLEASGGDLKKSGLLHTRKISSRDITLFTKQLSSLQESGVNLLRGLNILSGQAGNKYLKSVIVEIANSIKDGKSFSESVSQYPGLFSGLYSSMVHSGEVSGNLEQTLKKLADFLENEEEFKNSVRSALVYPAFIFVVGVLTVLLLLGFVIPRLVTMFEDMGQALPLPTRMLIGLSGFLRSYWLFMLFAGAILIFMFSRWKATSAGRLYWDTIKLKTALLGEIVLKTEVSRLMHTLSLLLSSGMEILYSLNISSSVMQNSLLRNELQKFREDISKGSSLSSCLKDSKHFPGLVTNIVAVGEETGTLEKALMRVADGYEKDVEAQLKTLTRMLEPVIILIMGLIVGFIVLSMLLPIFQINLLVR